MIDDMIKIRHIVMFCIALFSALTGVAQSTMPDYVCAGALKHYWVEDNTPNSTYIWKIGEETQTSTGNEIFITWNKPYGNYILTVREVSEAGCPGPVQTMEVHVVPCSFNIPPPFIGCVEPLKSVIYNSATNELLIEQPDYYTFTPPDTRLDISGFDDSCQPNCSFTLHWRIDFSPTPDPLPPHDPVTKPPVSGTGQPSTYGSNILFPGDGVGDGNKFNDVVHTITYWIEDSAGNKFNEQQQTITVKPRPYIK
jgi:hypothetical protein